MIIAEVIGPDCLWNKVKHGSDSSLVNVSTAAVAANVKVSKKDRSHCTRAEREQLSGRDFFEIFTVYPQVLLVVDLENTLDC